MVELDTDLVLLRKKFTKDQLTEIRTQIVKLLIDEAKKNELTEDQIYLYGFEIVSLLYKYYREQVDKRYLLSPPKEFILEEKGRHDIGIGG